ncbi:MAG: septal ring lytic transglycosylase RlpA family protein [Steroidobacteraceae bacterium]
MKAAHPLSAACCITAALGLAGCFGTRPQHAPAPSAPEPSAPEPISPPSPDAVPDVVPRAEPRSRNGNPPFYDVLGKRYYVLSSSVGYLERGVASWYGPGFHKVRTSIGEPYDMYAMTAAHTTLPLPTYVRVTNLQNGRSVVVRVNDRGPFVDNRIIDLSYTAASKLDMLRNGTAIVEVRSIDLTATATAAEAAPAASPPRAASGANFFVQAGAFSDPKNAERLADKLRGGGYGTVFVRDDEIAGRRMFRVRIGPILGVDEFDRIVAALERGGITDARLALD